MTGTKAWTRKAGGKDKRTAAHATGSREPVRCGAVVVVEVRILLRSMVLYYCLNQNIAVRVLLSTTPNVYKQREWLVGDIVQK